MARTRSGLVVGYRAHCEDCGTSVGPVRSSFMTATRDRQAHQLATAPPGSMHASATRSRTHRRLQREAARIDGHTAGVYKVAPAWEVA